MVEYNYAPERVGRSYFDNLFMPTQKNVLTLQDLIRSYFRYADAPTDAVEKAYYFVPQFVNFIMLPKADEKVKRENLRNHIDEYFKEVGTGIAEDAFETEYSPEEAAKVALRRMKDFQGYSAKEFYDLYDHFVNRQNLRSRRFIDMQTSDVERYEHLKTLVFSLRLMEGCLRSLRRQF